MFHLGFSVVSGFRYEVWSTLCYHIHVCLGGSSQEVVLGMLWEISQQGYDGLGL